LRFRGVAVATWVDEGFGDKSRSRDKGLDDVL
jgi:hypothetical protein